MELRNINTFLHIAELHSFSRTARQLGYSQSAVSSQIAQLEAELGAPLFDRVGKTVRLTSAGETFLGYARTLLTTAEQAQAALQPAKQISGSLRIALADSVCSTFLPGLLKRYHALCPQVELVLCTATADGMLQMLGTNQIDLAYTLDQPLLQPNLVLAADVPEPVCFIAPVDHPLAAQAEVTLEELTRQEFLLTERGMSYRDALDQRLAARGLAVQPYLELGSPLVPDGGAGHGAFVFAGIHRTPGTGGGPPCPAERAGLCRGDAPPAVLPPGQMAHPADERLHPAGAGDCFRSAFRTLKGAYHAQAKDHLFRH